VRGHRTIFNLLGPLINPGRPAHALVGVYSPAIVPKVARALEELGCVAGLVAHGIVGPGRGIDELTTATNNLVQGLGRLRSVSRHWSPEELGFAAAPFTELVGGDVDTNVALTGSIVAGRGPAGLADTIVLNAAAGLWITGRAGDIREGLPIARELLVGGAVAAKIAAMREFYRA